MQELSASRAEGDNRLASVQELSDKLLLETAPPGQQQLSRDVTALINEWQSWSARLATTQAALHEALSAWQQFDDLSDELTAWLRGTEVALTDAQLKSTLADKQAQLAQFKVATGGKNRSRVERGGHACFLKLIEWRQIISVFYF